MTEVQFDTLAWLTAREAQTGKVPTQAATARHFGLSRHTVLWRWRQLIDRGCIASCEGGTVILEEGRWVLKAGKEAATARRCTLPPADAPLPSGIPLSLGSMPLIKAVYQAAQEGRALTFRELAGQLGKKLSAVAGQVRTLRKHGVIIPGTKSRSCDGGHVQLTALGVGVADGRVTLLPPHRTGRPRKPALAVPSPKVSAPARGASTTGRAAAQSLKPAVASCRPAPTIRREAGSVPLPLPSLPELPAPVRMLRGVRHPAPPQAHAAPKGTSASAWKAMTTVRSASGWS